MDLKGQEGELKFTLQITRAATGKTETVDLIGKIVDQIEISEDLQEESELQHTDLIDIIPDIQHIKEC